MVDYFLKREEFLKILKTDYYSNKGTYVTFNNLKVLYVLKYQKLDSCWFQNP